MAQHWHPRECKVCGARASAVSISQTGLCPDHSKMRREANLRDLVSHRGVYFEHWRRRCVAAFGGVLLDDVREQG